MDGARAMIARMLAESAVSSTVDAAAARFNPKDMLPDLAGVAGWVEEVGELDDPEPDAAGVAKQAIAWASIVGIVGGVVSALANAKKPTWNKSDTIGAVAAGSVGLAGLYSARYLARWAR